MTHTPGPWHAGVKPSGFVYDKTGAQIADCASMLPIEEAKANGRLIATAPELLEALERMLAICPHYQQDGLTSEWPDKARAVINKAKGGVTCNA